MKCSRDIEDWKLDLLDSVKGARDLGNYWVNRIQAREKDDGSVHLAILKEPYLQYVLEGIKTVESRFSVVRCAPFEQVSCSDIVLLKESGGPVVGICEVEKVWFYNIDPESWHEIKDTFSVMLCAKDPQFWRERKKSKYATLMKIKKVKSFSPITCFKKDRRGWVILNSISRQEELLL